MLFVSLILASLPSVLAAPPAAVLERLQRSFTPVIAVEEASSGRSLSGCPIVSVTFRTRDPVDGSSALVEGRVYRSKGPATGKSVIIIPPTGGENVIDQGYANALCSSGLRAFLLRNWTKLENEDLALTVPDDGAVRAIAAIRHALDYLGAKDPHQVGILGTSLGALSSALALGFDPRLADAVLIVGGVGLAEIYASSMEKGAIRRREARMKEFGLNTPEEYLAVLRQNISIEPADFYGFSGPKNIMSFVGAKDITVATKNQRDLVKLYGAAVVEYDGNHFNTIVNAYWAHRRKIVKFFLEGLR